MFERKKIFILGMARSGYEVAKVLSKKNKVIINDLNDKQDIKNVNELKRLKVEVILGYHPENIIDESIDYIIKNPGIRNDHQYVKRAIELNIPVINEVEVAYLLLPKDVYIIGITGSNGKTTTTTIIYEFLKEAKKRVHLGGNIGIPFSKLLKDIKSKDILVLEISSHQLCNFDKFKTNMSLLLNLYETHLDFFKDYEDYINTKKRIFNHHTKSDIAIFNCENKDVVKAISDIMSEKECFSVNNENVNGAYIKDEYIYFLKEKIIKLDEILIKGKHNYENILAAVIVAKKLGVDNSIIQKVLKTFKGVEHRIEYVKEFNNRKIYNDSKSTNIMATKTALNSFEKNIILLLGGLDRGQSFDELKEYKEKIKFVVCYGETKKRIKGFCDNANILCYEEDNLEKTTKKAYLLSSEGDVILLSPACASWDQFKDFEERGKKFKEYINKLEEL